MRIPQTSFQTKWHNALLLVHYYQFQNPWDYLMALSQGDPFGNAVPVWLNNPYTEEPTEEQRRITLWLHEHLGHITGSFPVAKLPGLLDRFEKFGHLPEGHENTK